MEFEKFYLINAYVPNAKSDLSRLMDRQNFDSKMNEKVKELLKKK